MCRLGVLCPLVTLSSFFLRLTSIQFSLHRRGLLTHLVIINSIISLSQAGCSIAVSKGGHEAHRREFQSHSFWGRQDGKKQSKRGRTSDHAPDRNRGRGDR